jgi:hypothetical protein
MKVIKETMATLRVTMELSIDEAQALYDASRGGRMTKAQRGLFRTMGDSLDAASEGALSSEEVPDGPVNR